MKLLLRKLFREKLLTNFLLIVSVWILFFSIAQSAYSQNIINLKRSDSPVIEFLKLSVASKYKDAWLQAEINSWEPWLKEKKGFIDRQLFWDPQREEALLLIKWANRSDWKSISQDEIDSVQELFEEIAIDSIGNNVTNPFPIKSQGELLPQ